MDEIAERWGDYIADSSFDDLPDQVRKVTKWLVLDTLATTLGANTLGVGIPALLSWMRSAGGTPQATVLGFPDRVPVVTAAMINGAMAHALNFDDTTAVGSGHLGPVTMPLALASAELRGRTTGRHLMVSIATGAELMSRMGLAISNVQTSFSESKPQPTQMPGYLAAAATAARSLKFDATRARSALGLAFMQASGGRQPVLEGRPAKAIYAAFPCHGGMLSAILAQGDLRGDCDVFEGKAGYFHTYYGGNFDRSALLDGLGEHYSMLNVGFKPWPTTGVAHVFIEAAIKLSSQARLRAGDIEHVLLKGEPHIQTFCEPLTTRRNPQAPVEAEDSVIFATAKALTSGTVTLADLQPDERGLFDPDALAVANVTDYEIRHELGKSGIVEVKLHSGKTLSQRVDHPKGHRDNPLPDSDRRQKFFDCAAHANIRYSQETLLEVINLVEHLEELEDVGDLTRLLRG